MKTLFQRDEKVILLRLARKSIKSALAGSTMKHLDISEYPEILQKNGATFVTLTKHGKLRGCIGTLEAYQPLVQDVCEHARAAAFDDYRFSPVSEAELGLIEIEISYLTEPEKLEYADWTDLIQKLRPEVDGVILREGFRKATFLPQVWEQLPGVEEFLSHLCIKMGSPSDIWKRKHLDVQIYQVEHFSEGEFAELLDKN